MPAQLYMPEDFAEMMGTLLDWSNAEIEDGWISVWGRTDAPAPPKPYVWIEPITPPAHDGRGDEGIVLQLQGRAVLVRTVLPATTYTITLNGVDAEFISSASPDANEIRDGLAAALDALAEPVTISTPLDGVILVRKTGTDPVPDLELGANLEIKVLHATERDAVMTFQVDCLGDGQDPANPGAIPRWSSVAQAMRLRNSLGSVDALELLRTGGWTVISVEGDRKPDLVAGSRWEDRAGFDVRLRCRTRRIAALDWIEDAPIDTSIQGELSV